MTIDPASAMDLDQALHVGRAGDGFVVHYAIADVAAFVQPGDPVDHEAHRRGETLYGADSKVPLHPPAISEDAGPLLPDQDRPALLWTIRVDDTGEGTDVTVERALVAPARSSTTPRRSAGSTTAAPRSRCSCSRRSASCGGRGKRHAAGSRCRCRSRRWTSTDDVALHFRSQLPVEQWNAQISLLTGFAAAALTVSPGRGCSGACPPDPREVARLRRPARALGIPWPAEQPYPDFVRSLHPPAPARRDGLACTRPPPGRGYAALDGETPTSRTLRTGPAYAHVTAPCAASPTAMRARSWCGAVLRRGGARRGRREAARPA